MDITIAISTLKAISLDLDSKVSGYTAQKDSVDLAISQLEGKLETQLTELEDLKAKNEKPA